MGLLGISRQDQTRERILLMPQGQKARTLARRLLWFAALWLGGVGTVAIVSFGLKLWIAPK